MSYLVLARKYRPQTFDEVVGQEHVTTTLKNAFKSDRVHHAFLFCGPRGCGKTTTARILAKALNCQNDTKGNPCGTCSHCTSIVDGSALDYHEMDGASNRGIDAIRELNDATRYQPAIFSKKVYVIDEVHMLTTEAFNALLKTLEEPPPHVVFVLATTEPHKIPNTILSRCQRYDFKLVPSQKLGSHLETIFEKESVKMDPGALRLIVQESGGSVRDALSVSDQMISFAGEESVAETLVAEVLGVADKALTLTIVKSLLNGDATSALKAVSDALSRGVDEFQVARAMVRMLRGLMVYKVSGGDLSVLSSSVDEVEVLKELASPHDVSKIKNMFDRAIRGCDLLGKTEYPRMVLDGLLVELSQIKKTVALPALLERLGELEARLLSGGARPAAPKKKEHSVVQEPAVEHRARPSVEPQRSAAMKPSAASALTSQGETSQKSTTPVASSSTEAPTTEKPKEWNFSPDASPLKNWEKVMQALDEAREISLITVYQGAKVLEWTEHEVVVGFAKDGLTAELACSRERVSEIQAFLSKTVKSGFKMRIEFLTKEQEENAQSVLEMEQENLDNERKVRLDEAKEHPMTKTLLKTFDAQIKEIKVDV